MSGCSLPRTASGAAPARLNPTVHVAAAWLGMTPAQRAQIAAGQPGGGRPGWTWDKLVVAVLGLGGALFCVDSIAVAPRWEPGAVGLVANVFITLAYLAGD